MTHGTRLAEHAPIAGVLAGACLLLFGRALFWLFVGISGFVAGVFLAERFLGRQSELVTLAVGIAAGLLGACLAMFLQKLAVGIAGFFAGGYLAVDIANILGFAKPEMVWIVFLVGGVLGGALVFGLFDWALIILSSLMGASLITQGLHAVALVFLVLFIVGLVFQGGLRHRASRTAEV